MARGIKWRIQFKSKNERGVLINIYEEGYQSGADTTKTGEDVPLEMNEQGVTWITPAADPLKIQEGNDTNTLNFVRYKTGYLNVVETTSGQLDDLPPRSIMDHYVEAYYRDTLMFTGYMQCQEFQNGWEPSPRKLSFPVISPIGLAEQITFTPPATPGLTSLGALMQEITNGLNASYETVVYPYLNDAKVRNYPWHPWSATIRTVALCPYNSSFNHSSDALDLWAPKTYMAFLHGLCANYGWVLHDTPQEIVFDKFGTNDTWATIPVANLTNGQNITILQNTLTARALQSYYQYRDANATFSVRRPLRKLTAKYGTFAASQMSNNCEYARSVSFVKASRSITIVMNQIGPDVSSTNMNTGTYPGQSDGFGGEGLTPVAYGIVDNANDLPKVSLSAAYYFKWSNNLPVLQNKFVHLFKITFSSAIYKTTTVGNPVTLSCVLEEGASLANMWTTDNYWLYCNGSYCSSKGNGKFEIPLTINGNFYGLTWDVYLDKEHAHPDPVHNPYLRFSDIRITSAYSNVRDFYETLHEDVIFKGPDNGIGEENFSMEINGQYPGMCTEAFSTQIGGDGQLSGSLIYDAVKHVFRPLTYVEAKMIYIGGSAYTPHDYIYLYHWNQKPDAGYYWKILSKNFDFKTGNTELLIIHSPTFEPQTEE